MTLRAALLTLFASGFVAGCGDAPAASPHHDDAWPSLEQPDLARSDASLEEFDMAPESDFGEEEWDEGSEDPAPDLGDMSEVMIDPMDPPEPMDPRDPKDPKEPPPDSATFTIASWNVNFNNSVANVVTHTRKVVKADIVAFQELGSLSRARNIIEQLAAIEGGKSCQKCDYRAYFPLEGHAHADAIMWRKDKFKLIDKGRSKVNDPVNTNDCPGARNKHLTKSTVWVLLEERSTGARFMLSNNHLVASVEADGRWKSCAGAVRKKLFTNHMDGLIDTVKVANNKDIPIFVTGDFNVNYRADQRQDNRIAPFPYSRLSQHQVFANWYFLGMEGGKGTHGSRLIDYVHMSKAPKKLKPLSQAILGKGGSDHSPVRVRVELFRP